MSTELNPFILQELESTARLDAGEKVHRAEEARETKTSDYEAAPEISGLQILSLLGEGGSSKVYLAHDELINENVALKILKINSQDATALRRFIQEFTIFAAEKHPSITRLIDRSFTSDFAYITMEFFPGGDLSDRIAKGCSAAESLAIVKAIAEGLTVAHSRGIIHRDIKPRNIMFRANGSLAITDFGIARLDRGYEAAWAAQTLTMVGQAIGTPYYMSPEQIDDETTVDYRTDLYSLGVLFFECLTGVKPFQSESLPEMLEAHLKSPVPVLPVEQRQYQAIVERLMAKKPEDRYESAEELITELQVVEPSA